MLILLGQGNPGPKYAGNRHNFGFMALDEMARRHGFGPWKSKFQSLICEGTLPSEAGPVRSLLIKPQTFYNETGRALSEALRFYKLTADDVVIYHDEIDLAPGRFRMKKGGGHSGNNGLRSIMAHLGPDFRRARMGIGHPGDKSLVMPYVLSDFPKADEVWRDSLLAALAQSVGFLAAGEDERYQTDVMRLAPAPKHDPRKSTD